MSNRHACLGEIAEALAARGAQLTALRREVLGLILKSDGPMTAYQLLDELKKSRPGAAPPTVYRTLDFLLAQGLVHKLERLNAFISCADSGHSYAPQFLICNRCGSVAEIEDRSVSTALEKAAKREGFQPSHAMVEIEGLCAACSAH